MIRNLSGPGAAVDPGSLEERGGGERRAGYTCFLFGWTFHSKLKTLRKCSPMTFFRSPMSNRKRHEGNRDNPDVIFFQVFKPFTWSSPSLTFPQLWYFSRPLVWVSSAWASTLPRGGYYETIPCITQHLSVLKACIKFHIIALIKSSNISQPDRIHETSSSSPLLFYC